MAKKIIITRKIQLNVDFEKDSEEREIAFQNLFAWQRYTHRAANLIASHNFVQEKIKDMIYLTEETKVKLANVEKDEDGILNTSKLNTTYRILSAKFKGKIPTSILTTLNTVITQTYNAEKKEYFTGQRSLRSYRNNIPIPFQKNAIRNLRWDRGEANFKFELFGIAFKTYLGIDKSNNKAIIERIISGEYEMGDSSIQLGNKKTFLLLVVKFDKHLIKLDKDKVLEARLDFDTPIIAKIGRREFNIGIKEEYIHKRLSIQMGLSRLQTALKYNNGGKGRKKKLRSIEHFKKREKHFVDTKMHQYSFELIRHAIKNKAGIIKLMNVPAVMDTTKGDEFLLRNWSYYGLIEKIKYKASKWDIEVVIEK